MTHYAGIDVSLETSSICIVDGAGTIVRKLKAESDPDGRWCTEAGEVRVPLLPPPLGDTNRDRRCQVVQRQDEYRGHRARLPTALIARPPDSAHQRNYL